MIFLCYIQHGVWLAVVAAEALAVAVAAACFAAKRKTYGY